MMRPSRLSASYASLLPALNRLGYRADVREASGYGSRCMVVVSGAPDTTTSTTAHGSATTA